MAQAIKESLAMAESAGAAAAEEPPAPPPDATPVADLLSLDATQPEDEAGAEMTLRLWRPLMAPPPPPPREDVGVSPSASVGRVDGVVAFCLVLARARTPCSRPGRDTTTPRCRGRVLFYGGP